MQLKFFDAGQLRTAMVLEEPVETPDGQGGFSVTWTERASVWALLNLSAGGWNCLQTVLQCSQRTVSGCVIVRM